MAPEQLRKIIFLLQIAINRNCFWLVNYSRDLTACSRGRVGQTTDQLGFDHSGSKLKNATFKSQIKLVQ